MQRARWAIMALPFMLVAAGCGRDPATRQVRELRLAGHPDSARVLALSALGTHADRRSLWLEFARASQEMCRLSASADDPQVMESCLQAALVCAAAHQQKRTWGREWREAGRLVSAEVGRQLSRVMKEFTTQTQTAAQLEDLQRQYPRGAQESGPIARTEQQVQEYRNGAGDLLAMAVIWRRLLEALPELNPGMGSIYGAQLEERQTQWVAELQLEPGYTAPVQERARRQVDSALARLREDVNDVGHFLLPSVTENGVLP